MDLQWRFVMATATVGSMTLVKLAPEYSISYSYAATFLALFTFALSSVILWKSIIWAKFLSPLRHLPGPTGGTFWNGHFAQVVGSNGGEIVAKWVETIPNDGLIYYTSLLNDERVVVTTPEGLNEVLTTNVYDYTKPPIAKNMMRRIFGQGLPFAEGEEHKHQRKNLMPAFSYRHIKDLSTLFRSKSVELVTALNTHYARERKEQGQDSGNPIIVKINEWVDRAALDIIGLAGFGVDFGALQDPNNDLAVTYRTIFKPMRSRLLVAMLSFLIPEWIVAALPLPFNAHITQGTGKVRKAARKIIREKQEKTQRGEKRTDLDIMAVAIESGIFSTDALVEQALTFLGAGHETSSTTMTWSILELCRNPEMQTRLRKEVRANIAAPGCNEKLDKEELSKCFYLSAFCNEILRFHAPAALTARQTVRSTTILGQHIPKDTQVLCPIWGMNKSVELWGPDACDFNPDRWMAPGCAKNGGATNNYSFMTFLHGPHGCIGSAFARAELQYMLAMLVGSFEMHQAYPDRPIEIARGVTLKPKGGLDVILQPLSGW